MSNIFEDTMDYFESVIDKKIKNALSVITSTKHRGKVLYTDEEGVVWAEIPGVADALPVEDYTVNFSDGDEVTISIQDGHAILDGNLEDPALTLTIVDNILDGTSPVDLEDLDKVAF